MPSRKSAVEQRRDEIERHLARLRAQLTRKSRKDFTTDFRHRSWLKGTNALIGELLDELSALYAEAFYDGSPSCRMYADMTRAAAAAEDQGEAKLLMGLSARGDRGR